MVAVAELLANVVHGQGVHPPDQVDGHLTGRHDVAAPALAPDSILVQMVVLGHIADDDLRRGHIFVALEQHIPDGAAHGLLVHLIPQQIAVGQYFVEGALQLPHVGGDVLRDVVRNLIGQLDAQRSGFVIGEGGGALLLETKSHAKARGAAVYAELAGWANNNDAYHVTDPDPEGKTAAACMRQALRKAALEPGEVGYINAHGTGTPMNDSLETKVVKLALGEEEAKKAYMSSTKSMTGHMLGAAGAVEAIACLKALNESILPPTINLLDPDPACDLNNVPNVAIHADVDLVLSNSLGFGGHNACIAFRKVTK